MAWLDGDRQFLLSVFLMEAWDTLAAVEEGLATLRSYVGSGPRWSSIWRS
mgnify:CR=1 FL=1